jgi:hypothetical protein
MSLPAAADIFAGLSEVGPSDETRDDFLASVTAAGAVAVAAAQAPTDLEDAGALSLEGSETSLDYVEGTSDPEEEEIAPDEGEAEEKGGLEEDRDESFLPVREAFEALNSEQGQPGQPDDDKALIPGALAASSAMAASQRGDPGRIRFSGDVVFGMPPPRRPWQRAAAWFNDDEKRKTLLFTLLGAMTVGFAYLGFVLGSSIEGGGGSGGEIPAVPTRAANVCGETPTTLDQGSRATLTFDARSLPDYQISAVSVRGVSANASQQAVTASAQPGLSVQFEALPAPGPAGRTDEYKLLITFARGDQTTIAECTVFVKAPTATATPTTVPATATPAPTATRTPAPVVPTSPPVIQPTMPPPQPTATSTPALCTPTPAPPPIATSPPIPFPTFTPIPVPCP